MKLKRITPRTCLWPLTGSLILCFGLSIALTFRSNDHCYAGVCGEWLFPLQARLHVVIWYSWISVSVTILAVRAFYPSIRQVLQKEVCGTQLPLVRKRLTVSGILMVLWVAALYGIITGVWWSRLHDYFVARGQQGGVLEGNTRLAAVALTGHYADVTMGMVLLPVARNSALASFFRLSASTTFAFHIIQAYILFTLVVIHGLAYAAWTAIYYRDMNHIRSTYPILNPTYLYDEVWPGDDSSLGIWRASLVFTGLVATLIMLMIAITTLPVIRRKHFNLFYFTHLLVIVAVVVICLHASTMFYCTAPGLAMWILDWGMRIYELSGKVDCTIEALGKGWFLLALPLPRRRLDGCACHSPLAHFHIHHQESSIREIHPFTTITYLASHKVAVTSSTARKVIALSNVADETIKIQFLFRRSEHVDAEKHFRKQGARLPSKQWTNKLASLVDEAAIGTRHLSADEGRDPEQAPPRQPRSKAELSLRLEGPYFIPAEPANYQNVICLIAGTGISGAIAIAAAFSAQLSATASANAPVSIKWKRCTILWSVRESDFIELPLFQENTPGLEVRPHLTGAGRERLDAKNAMRAICCTEESRGSTWVYISGPNPFIETAEMACRDLGVAFFGARWA